MNEFARDVYGRIWDHLQEVAAQALMMAHDDDRPQGGILKLYDIGICPKCWQTYVVTKWPHRCQPRPGGPR